MKTLSRTTANSFKVTVAEEFKVTREIVQELAETGAVQLPIATLTEKPEHSNTSLRNGRIVQSYELLESHTLNGLGVIAKKFFEIASEPPPRLIRTMEWTDERGCGWHVDPETSMGGIAILITSRMGSDERLHACGRSFGHRTGLSKRYCYEKGPIVLAQAGFGRQLLKPGSPLNGAWHMAERSLKSRFRAIDFIP